MKFSIMALTVMLFIALLLMGNIGDSSQAAPTTLAAQSNANTQVCNVAFTQGIRDNYHVFSHREQFAIYQKRLCDVNFSTYQAFRDAATSLGLDAITAEGMFGLTGTDAEKSAVFSQKYRSFCGDTFFNEQNRQRYQSYISQVSPALTTNWVRCVEAHLNAWLNINGVFASVSPNDSFSGFVVQVKVKTPAAQPITINALHPDGAVTCTRQGQPISQFPSQPISSNEFTLTCAKNPNQPISFVIETNFGQSQVVTVPAATSKILEMEDRITALQSALNTLNGAISQGDSSLGQRITSLDDKVNSRTSASWKECQNVPVGPDKTHNLGLGDWCPNGWYIVGLDFNGSPSLHVAVAKCCRPVP